MIQTNQLNELMEYSASLTNKIIGLTNKIIGLNNKIIEIINLQQEESDDYWISVKEASRLLGITPSGIRYKINHNIIKSKRKGEKVFLVSKSDILKLSK